MTTDVIHFLILMGSLAMISVGLWLVHPAAMFVGVGAVMLSLLVCARWSRKRSVE
jgi:hypothetical protein